MGFLRGVCGVWSVEYGVWFVCLVNICPLCSTIAAERKDGTCFLPAVSPPQSELASQLRRREGVGEERTSAFPKVCGAFLNPRGCCCPSTLKGPPSMTSLPEPRVLPPSKPSELARGPQRARAPLRRPPSSAAGCPPGGRWFP